ncbi:MAG: hypothetical protein QF692_03020 [Alphaproteobacteria bacterium]|jgi:hypothetical protein|nr:hypothetical protein [Alphaproteobacteria bacterium]MDP7222215.1 hypothetical protein [Alphaproteobacteria bacterium]
MQQTLISDKKPSHLTAQDFLAFGVNQIAYIKPVQDDNGTAYSLYAADGTLISTFDSEERAATGALHNSLAPVIVH